MASKDSMLYTVTDAMEKAMNQVGNSRVDTVLKLLLATFIALFAFSSGVYFGKQMSDSDYKLKALESDFNHSSKVAGHAAKELDVQPEEAVVDEEVATLSDKFVNAERDDLAELDNEGATEEKGGHGKEETRKVASAESHGDEHAAPAHEEVASGHGEGGHQAAAAHGEAANHGKPDLSAAHRAAERIANNSAPVEAHETVVHESRKPSALPKTVGTSGAIEFTVQVASYPTAAAAKEHANELVKKGFPAFPVEATVNGRTWYRVSVGSFKTMRDATQFRAQLLKQADLKSAIVQRIQR